MAAVATIVWALSRDARYEAWMQAISDRNGLGKPPVDLSRASYLGLARLRPPLMEESDGT